jgi:hypothetical protein
MSSDNKVTGLIFCVASHYACDMGYVGASDCMISGCLSNICWDSVYIVIVANVLLAQQFIFGQKRR